MSCVVTSIQLLRRHAAIENCSAKQRERTFANPCRVDLTMNISHLLETWILDNMGTMLRREKSPLPTGTPEEYIGRDSAIIAIQNVAKENFRCRMKSGHAYFTFLAASGHVRNGKTRAGIETSRLVEDVCSELSRKRNHRGTRTTFSKPVYLLVDFQNGAKYDSRFDVHNMDPSVALGARLMYAFYQHDPFKAINHDKALKHIIETVLAEGGDNDSMVVPVVIHFDEHGKFIQAMSNCRRANRDGKIFFNDMLKCLGSAATSLDSALSHLKASGRFFLVPITTGRSHNDASFSQVSKYGVKAVPLPLLSISNTRKLARAFLKAYNIETGLLSNTVFQIALCDCGSLPGLIELLCQTVPVAKNLYVHYLHNKVKETVTRAPDWNVHWGSLASIFFARVKISTHASINGTFTLKQVLATGTVSYDYVEREIRLAPVLLRIFNMQNPSFDPRLLKLVSEEKEWTRDDFKKAHLLYLAAAMMALQKERRRFTTMTLSNFLCHVEPANNAYLQYILVFPSDVTFNGAGYESDDEQCLDRPRKRKRKQKHHCHSVKTECYDCVRRAATGTPYVDGYMNLILRTDMNGVDMPTTLFMQYNQSKIPRSSSPMKVSAMNELVQELEKALVAMGWETSRRWLLLWVTNRKIKVDIEPHEKLLWVGRNNLEKHVPLIGRRGLI
jgi:hypothetical protein